MSSLSGVRRQTLADRTVTISRRTVTECFVHLVATCTIVRRSFASVSLGRHTRYPFAHREEPGNPLAYQPNNWLFAFVGLHYDLP